VSSFRQSLHGEDIGAGNVNSVCAVIMEASRLLVPEMTTGSFQSCWDSAAGRSVEITASLLLMIG